MADTEPNIDAAPNTDADAGEAADAIALPARRYGPSKFVWWYDSIIDRMLAHPDWSITAIARDMGRSAGWVGTITNSDTFKLHYARRRDDHNTTLNETLAEGIVGRVNDVAIKTLDLISERLDENPLGVTFDQLTALSDSVLTKLGYGAKNTSAVSVTAHGDASVVVANETAFREAQTRIRDREQRTLDLKRNVA